MSRSYLPPAFLRRRTVLALAAGASVTSLAGCGGGDLESESLSAMELIADIAGPDSLPVAELDAAAANGSADIESPEWAQRSVPTYLNYRKVTIYGGSSEVQRQIIDKAVLGL